MTDEDAQEVDPLVRIRRLLGRIPGSADVNYKSTWWGHPGERPDLTTLVDDLEAGIAKCTEVVQNQESELLALREVARDVAVMRRVLGTG